MPLIMGRSSHAAAAKRTTGLTFQPGDDSQATACTTKVSSINKAQQLLAECMPPMQTANANHGRGAWGESSAVGGDQQGAEADAVPPAGHGGGTQGAQSNKEESNAASPTIAFLERRISELDNQAEVKPAREWQEQVLNKVIGAVIILNTMMMGLELDYGPNQDAPPKDRVFPWLICESIVIVIFISEICLRVNWEREEWSKSSWNLADLGIVSAAIVETWVLPFVNASNRGLQMLTLLRIVRLVRLIRVVRLVRMFHSLYISVMAFKAALSSIFYICILMVMGLFICAIFTTSTIGHSQDLKNLQMGTNVTGSDRFGSVPRSMYSLFELMTLEGWEQVGRPLVMEEPIMSVFLFGFIMVFTFGILNMIVAMVVEKTLTQARVVEETGQKELMHQVAEELRNMKTCFEEIDSDGSGQITRDELVDSIQNNEKVRACFRSLNIPVRDANTLFSIIDSDCSDSLSVEELLEGLARIRGATDPDWDQLAMYAMVRNLTRQVQQLHGEVKEVLGDRTSTQPIATKSSGSLTAVDEVLRASAATATSSGAAGSASALSTPAGINGPSMAGGSFAEGACGASGSVTAAIAGGSVADVGAGDFSVLPGEVQLPEGERRPWSSSAALPQQEAEFQAEVLKRLDAMASAQAAAQREVLRRLEILELQLSGGSSGD